MQDEYKNMAEYVKGIGAQVTELNMKLKAQEEINRVLQIRSTADPKLASKEKAPAFAGKRNLGKKARLWTFAARSYAKAVAVSENEFGVYKLTSQFGDAERAWQLNGKYNWTSPTDVIKAVETEFVNQFDRIAIRQQLLRVKQKKGENLAQFTARFEELSVQVDDYSQEQLVMMYTDGMAAQHKEPIIMALPKSMPEAKMLGYQRDRLQGSYAGKTPPRGEATVSLWILTKHPS